MILIYRDPVQNTTIHDESHHQQLISLVKDYIEIVLMSLILSMLMLKKKLVYDCIRKKLKENEYKIPSDPEMQLRQID